MQNMEFIYSLGRVIARPVNRYWVFLISEYNERTDEWEKEKVICGNTDLATAKSIARHYRERRMIPAGSTLCIDEYVCGAYDDWAPVYELAN